MSALIFISSVFFRLLYCYFLTYWEVTFSYKFFIKNNFNDLTGGSGQIAGERENPNLVQEAALRRLGEETWDGKRACFPGEGAKVVGNTKVADWGQNRGVPHP